MDRNPSRLLSGVDGCSAFEQEAGGFEVADGGGGMERHDLHGVRGHGIRSGSILEQHSGGFGLAEKTGEVQGGESVF
jgi:hypothetical protein